jgi:hypothetical protein
MDTYGCTTPFGPNKTHICTNETVALKALKLYKEAFDDHKNLCDSPCSYIMVGATKTKNIIQGYVNGRKNAYMIISPRENIKVTTGHELYSFLSLIAEIGGYVGLFLGVSINQATVMIDQAIFWLSKQMKE